MKRHLLEQETSDKRVRNIIVFGTLWLPVFIAFFYVVIRYLVSKCTSEEIEPKEDFNDNKTPKTIETSTVTIPKALGPSQSAKNLSSNKINESLLSNSRSVQNIREPDDFIQLKSDYKRQKQLQQVENFAD